VVLLVPGANSFTRLGLSRLTITTADAYAPTRRSIGRSDYRVIVERARLSVIRRSRMIINYRQNERR